MVAAAHQALSSGFHQYTRTAGHPRLVQLLAKRYSQHFGREVDPFSQVRVVRVRAPCGSQFADLHLVGGGGGGAAVYCFL